MNRSVVVDVTARGVLRATVLYSLYLLFAGHNQPGGGFVGGLVVSAAVAFAYVAGGVEGVRRLLRPAPWTVLGCGLALAVGTAIAPMVVGASVLGSGAATVDLPAVGALKVTSTVVFDTGVFAVVVGLVLMVFEAFGEELPETDLGT